MNEKRLVIWNDAAVPGLILGGVSILYLVLNMLIGKIAGGAALTFLAGVLNFLTWGAKLFLCIFLMRLFLINFSKANPEADNRKVMHFGMVVAFYSALLYSGAYLVYMLYINPEAIAATMELVMQQYAGILDGEAMESMENITADMPSIMFFCNLIWCMLWGFALSGIFSRNIPANADDPFKKQ